MKQGNQWFSVYTFMCLLMAMCVQTTTSQSRTTPDTLRIGVAVTTRHLMKLALPAFSAKNPDMNITSYIQETGNVVDDVIVGKASVAVTTRNLKDYEKAKSLTIMGTPIGLDGLVLAVSNSIPVESLTFEQITAIWTGAIINWEELGGPNLPIVVIGRPKNYDPIKLFCDFMHLDSKPTEGGELYSLKGKNQWSVKVAAAPETDKLALELLEKTPGAITYFPLQVLKSFKAKGCNVKALKFNGIEATPQTIANGEYFIHRRLNVMTNGEPNGAAMLFVDFLLSETGQQLVKQAGFLPIEH
jgi:phosphate transport system substrate-binding protein